MSEPNGHKQPTFQEADLLAMSPFTWDRSVNTEEVERTSRAGAPYTVMRMAIRPVNSTVKEPFMVEVFQRTGRRIQILTMSNHDPIIVATESAPDPKNGFTNVILSLKRDKR